MPLSRNFKTTSPLLGDIQEERPMTHMLTRIIAGMALTAAGLLGTPDAAAVEGDILWQFQRGTRIQASPAVCGAGIICIGSDDGRIYAVDADGVEVWQFATQGDIVASPAVGADDTLYAGSTDGVLYALDRDGNPKWRYATGSAIVASPAVGPDGGVVVGTEDATIHALTDTGTEAVLRWRIRTQGAVRSSPALNTAGTLYVGSDDQHLHAVAADGTLKWRYPTGGAIRSSPAIGTDGTVYVGSDDGHLYALADADGEGRLKWRFETGGLVQSSPVIDTAGRVIVGADDGVVYALRDEETRGVLEWDFETFGPVRSSAAVGADGGIYIGSLDGVLYGLGVDGTERWTVRLGEMRASPVIVQNGTLYAGTQASFSTGVFQNGRLYAVETGTAGILHAAPWPMFRHDVRHTGRNTLNQPPLADAGGDRNAVDGQRVTLDGSHSTDPDYGIAAFRWRQTGGDPVVVTGETDARMSFVASDIDTAKPLTFELTVTDNGGLTAADTASVSFEKDDNFCFIRSAAEGFLPYID